YGSSRKGTETRRSRAGAAAGARRRQRAAGDGEGQALRKAAFPGDTGEISGIESVAGSDRIDNFDLRRDDIATAPTVDAARPGGASLDHDGGHDLGQRRERGIDVAGPTQR